MTKCSRCFQVYQWPPWLLPPWALLLKRKNKPSEAILEFYGLEMGSLRGMCEVYIWGFSELYPWTKLVFVLNCLLCWTAWNRRFLGLANTFLLKCLCATEELVSFRELATTCIFVWMNSVRLFGVQLQPPKELQWRYSCFMGVTGFGKWREIEEAWKGDVIHWVLDNTV